MGQQVTLRNLGGRALHLENKIEVAKTDMRCP